MKKLITVWTFILVLNLPLAAADAATGKAAYAKACKSCHGPDGAGNPAVAKMMKVEMKPLAVIRVVPVKSFLAEDFCQRTASGEPRWRRLWR